MAPKLKFSDGEKVLCFHGPLLYEAKCIKSQTKDKNTKYFIHYSGWNKNWDEWVPESRVLKYNDANMQKQKELEAAHGRLALQGGIIETQQGKKWSHGSSKRALRSSVVMKAKKTKTGMKTGIKKEPTDRESTVLPVNEKTPKPKIKKEVVPAPTPPTENNPLKKSRTRLDINVETEEEYVQKIEIKIRIPDELKHWIVDDWACINREKKLFNLPARVNIEKIIEEYMRNRLSVKGLTANKEAAINEMVNGIREYFNVMLGKQLLYRFERPQYNDIMSEHSDKLPTQIYGAMHLLRLFSKIGSALAYTALDEEGVSVLSSSLYDFLKYLTKSTTPLFSLSDYSSASAEYLKKATL